MWTKEHQEEFEFPIWNNSSRRTCLDRSTSIIIDCFIFTIIILYNIIFVSSLRAQQEEQYNNDSNNQHIHSCFVGPTTYEEIKNTWLVMMAMYVYRVSVLGYNMMSKESHSPPFI